MTLYSTRIESFSVSQLIVFVSHAPKLKGHYVVLKKKLNVIIVIFTLLMM